jgi:predicted nucleic acid-binding protein
VVQKAYATGGGDPQRDDDQPISAHDLLIAAHARAIDAICVTDNVSEFKRVPALKVESWLR